jgi:hypothetical protein
MSVSSMTNVAYRRRTDVPPLDSMPSWPGEVAEATGDAPDTQNTFTSALTALMAYIPTEILTAYVAVLAGLEVAEQQTQAPPGAWVLFWIFLVLTPALVWALYAGKCRTAGKVLPTNPRKWPMWEMSAATIAFVVWAFTLPNTGFADLAWYRPGVATAAVLLVTIVLAGVAPIVQQPIEGDTPTGGDAGAAGP